jgi:AraC-like DNA-binding protein/TolB-like protein
MSRAISALPTSQAHPAILPHSLRKALAFLRANSHNKVSLADVASACGLSQRTLLRQFACFLGVSPIAHLLRIRLAAVHVELTQSHGRASISEVAHRCGITHMGRFATEYRKAFGEPPSATLRRASEVVQPKGNNGASASASVISRQRPSLMIMPLRTEKLLERHLAQELVELLAARLSRARVAELFLNDPAIAVPRRTAWSSRGTDATQYCLHGRLVLRDDRVRVTLWLVDTDGLHVWGDSYDGKSDDLFDLLRRASDGAVLGVIPGITGAEIERVRRKDPRTLAAREILMQALPVLLKNDIESARKGFAIASHAMNEVDPIGWTGIGVT